ncbi:RagB/SusD family nutrient uptake outer membrane protein [Carboxylicivirga sp. RSCT41]|uniref:RagB/SusD family nutrient uptake outer membrane protein n=1 Tax=Carboxylicivirga agarovorans TaxID=3417570 RepID=UPI003D33643A
MKKIKLNIVSVLWAVIITMTGCSLDIEPTDYISDSKAYETIEDLEKGMIGVINSYGSHNIVGMSDWASDDLRYSLANTGQGVQVHNWDYNSSTGDLAGTWNEQAKLVDRANRILTIAGKFDAEDETVQRIIGECLFTRAYGHFNVVRMYCKNYEANDPLGTPYKFESGVTYPSRLPQGVVYQNILKDIDAAIPALSDRREKNYFMTKSAAYALKARVAQYMREWDMAIAAADEAIGLGGFRLATIEEYSDIWRDEMEDNVEVIFRLRRESSGIGNYYQRSTNNDIFFHPSYDLMNQYATDDIRQYAFFATDEDNQDIVGKHIGRPNDKKNANDVKVFRVSEMVLIKAEAYAQKSMLNEAAAELNHLRNHRLASPGVLSFASQSETMQAVMDERRRELAYEGHRFYDLKRWGLGIERLPEDSETTSRTLEAGDYRFVFPIPQTEIFANENMIQNDGYSN